MIRTRINKLKYSNPYFRQAENFLFYLLYKYEGMGRVKEFCNMKVKTLRKARKFVDRSKKYYSNLKS